MVQRVRESVSGKATVIVVDVDEHPDLARDYKVRGIPALLIFKNGEVVDQVRSRDENGIREQLLSHAE